MFYEYLNSEEEQELVSRLKKGDIAARDTLVMSCTAIMLKESRISHKACLLSREDLFQTLRAHLLKEAKGYRHAEGKRFTYFAKSVCRFKVCEIIKYNSAKKRYRIRVPLYEESALSNGHFDRPDDIEIFITALYRIPVKLRKYIIASIDFETLTKLPTEEAAKEFPNFAPETFHKYYRIALEKVKIEIKHMNVSFPFSLKEFKSYNLEYIEKYKEKRNEKVKSMRLATNREKS